MARLIIVTGGVVSSLGKGIAAASIGCVLEAHGYSVSNLKVDPYLNFDPGTQSPKEHGECYVTYDGAETDLDLGHYERFTTQQVSRLSNFTNGQIFSSVIEKERRGDYLGKTVQIVPHITDEIKDRIIKTGGDNDFLIVEVGGTVGDIESAPILEALRQLRFDVGKDNILYIHMALAPHIAVAQETKTKPVQSSVKEIRQIGIQPDIVLVRAEKELEDEHIAKISLFCNVDKDCVFQSVDVDDIYKIPLMYANQYLDTCILNKFRLRPSRKHDVFMQDWKELIGRLNPVEEVRIAVIGKYIELNDAYKSIYEALRHAGFATGKRVKIIKINPDEYQKDDYEGFCERINREKPEGLLVPGGFGNRGIEGKVLAARYCRENNVPYFGICLGMQVAVIEYARNVCGLENANSTEFDESTPYPVIDIMEEQKNIQNMGATMRLGNYKCELSSDTKSLEAYQESQISERHRHRYEFNDKYKGMIEEKGMIISGTNPETGLAEIVENTSHNWFIGCQFHPEFNSRPLKPHPLFVSFVKACSTFHNPKGWFYYNEF